MPGKAVCYARVSTEEQAREGVSLHAQEERLRTYCKLKDLEVVDFIREEGVSASKPLATRPGGKDLIDLVKAGVADQVVALKLDRLFRDAEDALHETRVWDKAGVALHLVDFSGQAVDTSTPMGRMFLTMTAAFAELERNLISERTKNALDHKKRHREAYGPVPFGYERQEDVLVELDDEQAVLSRIQEWDKAGMSLRAIARKLRAEGVPTKRGGQWAAATVRYMLRNDLHQVATP